MRLLFFLLLTYAPTSYSETLLEAGIHLGGSELITQNYANGAKDSIKAGDLFSLSIGGMKSYTNNIEGQLSFGVKSDDVHSTDADVTWVRYPLNSMVFYRGNTYRIGLGVTIHFSPNVKGTGVASNISQRFQNSLGALLEFDYKINKSFFWGLRYTSIDYKPHAGGRHVNGDSIGLLIIALL